MTPLEIKAEINKNMTRLDVKLKDLGRVCGRPQPTMYEHMRSPEKLTLDDLEKITGYLGMKITVS